MDCILYNKNYKKLESILHSTSRRIISQPHWKGKYILRQIEFAQHRNVQHNINGTYITTHIEFEKKIYISLGFCVFSCWHSITSTMFLFWSKNFMLYTCWTIFCTINNLNTKHKLAKCSWICKVNSGCNKSAIDFIKTMFLCQPRLTKQQILGICQTIALLNFLKCG